MVSEDLKEWYEKHRYADLKDAQTKTQLRALLREEPFLSAKARRRLFEHFVEEEVAGVGIRAVMKGTERKGAWRNTKTGRFAKSPAVDGKRKNKRWESWE